MVYLRTGLLIIVNKNLILLLPNCHGGSNKVKRIQTADCLRKWYLDVLFSILSILL